MAVAEEHECPRVDERVEWIYTYGDMVTLLLAFFILLFATAKTEEEKLKAISAAFRGGPPASPYVFSGLPTFMDNLQSVLKKGDIDAEGDMAITEKGITVSFNETAFFKPGSATLTKGGLDTIEKFAKLLYTVPNSIVIEGHTDNRPIKSKLFPSNWELSSARAAAVTRAMEEFGIKDNRLEIAAYGSTKPKGDNSTEQGRRINRRIDILVKPDDGPP